MKLPISIEFENYNDSIVITCPDEDDEFSIKLHRSRSINLTVDEAKEIRDFLTKHIRNVEQVNREEKKRTLEDGNLQRGTLKCPDCNNHLEFEVAGTMRICRKKGDYMVYHAQCTKHGKKYKRFTVIARKAKKDD